MIKYALYWRKTPLERKLASNSEKFFQDILSNMLIVLMLIVSIGQKAIRETMKKNPEYTAETIYDALMSMFLVLFLIFIVCVVYGYVLHQSSKDKTSFLRGYFIDNEVKYYLVGRLDKENLLFKTEIEDSENKKIYGEMIKEKSFIINKNFIFKKKLFLLSDIKETYVMMKENYKDSPNKASKVGVIFLGIIFSLMVSSLFVGVFYFIYLLN
nr:hypothetical protein [Carnobacterium maltaromaticum]